MTDKPHFCLAARVIPHGLNLHIAPGSEQLVDALPRDMKVVILDYQQQPKFLWAYISVPARHEHGWVRADYLAFDPPVELPRIELPEVEPITAPWHRLVLALAVLAALAYALATCVHFAATEIPLP